MNNLLTSQYEIGIFIYSVFGFDWNSGVIFQISNSSETTYEQYYVTHIDETNMMMTWAWKLLPKAEEKQ